MEGNPPEDFAAGADLVNLAVIDVRLSLKGGEDPLDQGLSNDEATRPVTSSLRVSKSQLRGKCNPRRTDLAPYRESAPRPNR